MAIPTVVGVGAAISGIAGVTAPYPAAYTAILGDVAVTFIECESADVITPPTNWATVTTSTVGTGTTSKLGAIWRRLTAGEAAPAIADTGDHTVARMIVLRGVLGGTGNPWTVIPVQTTELVADTTVSTPTITTTGADNLILTAFGTGQDIASTAGATGWTNAALSSLTEQMDNWVIDGTGGGFAVATGGKAAAGATGATTATLSLTANFKTLMTIAIAPVPSGRPPARRAPRSRGSVPIRASFTR